MDVFAMLRSGATDAVKADACRRNIDATPSGADAPELEALLEAGTEKPDGLTYNAGTETWAMDGGDSWTFAAAAGGNPPKVSKN